MPPPARILIVEDESLVAHDLARRLARLGYTVVGRAATGVQAIHHAETLRPDLILMDVHLRGGMDGVEAARAIQTLAPIPIVYLSAASDAATIERMHATGAAGYLHKPVGPQMLGQTLRQVLSACARAHPNMHS
jgi:DNA-binding NarL/FixJ family response regulator